MICPTCTTEVPAITSQIRSGVIVTGCINCLARQHDRANEFSAKSQREWQKKQYRRDLVQPIQGRDFVRAHPEKARELYGDEQFRRLS